ncbi:family 1 glycosylhydrolase [uncultured Dubosiella sp.]|uniref:family 1 glycosylhydrolase n=1 Tax=uncultured Dubosiella sp. TaxID=1937011 RepID=UPI00262EBEF7|nr:family 1 glycosylhydrolase [uncultured Dubosiella sp.]
MIDLREYKKTQFPDRFLFGVATAGQQVEGNNCSWHDDPKYYGKENYTGVPWVPAGRAMDSYNRYEDDIALAKRMHLDAFRLSIEWSRIEPEQGQIKPEEIAHYVHILERLHEEGMKTIVTLHHVSHPIWFHDQGAFRTMENLSYFLHYVETIMPHIAPFADYILVLNELNIPFEYSIEERMNMLQYHAHAYHRIKQYTDAPVSSTISYSFKEPFRGSFDRADQVLADYVDWVENEFFFHAVRTGEIIMPYHEAVICPELKDSMDFWAVNTYIRQLIDSRKAFPISSVYEATHFKAMDTPIYTEEIAPEIMLKMLMRLNDKPVMITENGISCKSDKRRMEYIASMLVALHQGMEMGADVIGYLHWSLLDNWEWGSFAPIFGLAYCDKNYDRHLKKSGEFYGAIAHNKALTPEIIQEYYIKSQDQ